MNRYIIGAAMALGAAPAVFLSSGQADPPVKSRISSVDDLLVAKLKPIEGDPKADELKVLRIRRANAALKALQAAIVRFSNGLESPLELAGDGRRWRDSIIGGAVDQPTELILLEDCLKLFQWVEQVLEAKVEAGVSRPSDLERARFDRYDTEILVVQRRRMQKK